MTNPKKSFDGFQVPEQNWFKLPNNWTDITASMRSWAEHKVVEYVLRHTWGFHEYGQLKLITLDEFENGRKRKDGSRMDNGVGLRRQAILSGLKLAVEDGFLIVEVDDRDKGRVKKYYGLRMMVSSVPQGYEDHTPTENQGYEDHTPEVWKSYSRGMESIHRTEKETIERNPRKKKDSRQTKNDFAAIEQEYGTTERERRLWPEILQTLRGQMAAATFDAHLASSRLLSLTDETAIIGVSSSNSQEWVENRLKDLLQRTLAGHLDQPDIQLEFVLLDPS